MIHEQVQEQLEYLKYWVDSEIENERRCKKLNIPYTPSNRKWLDIQLYNEYKAEIEKNGDKNLLVMIKLDGKQKKHTNMRGIYPFAKREVSMSYGTYFLVHRTEHAEVLFTMEEVEVVS
jgi:hypothetical protein